jgi:hypothetical protein
VKEMKKKFLPKFELIDRTQTEIFDKLDEIEEKVGTGEGLSSPKIKGHQSNPYHALHLEPADSGSIRKLENKIQTLDLKVSSLDLKVEDLGQRITSQSHSKIKKSKRKKGIVREDSGGYKPMDFSEPKAKKYVCFV